MHCSWLHLSANTWAEKVEVFHPGWMVKPCVSFVPQDSRKGHSFLLGNFTWLGSAGGLQKHQQLLGITFFSATEEWSI